ncbi:hypothetical protein DF18_03455 [Streptomyces rimosus]|nr:hypothetical protein DF18_03455 [Streptomyces rimosus]
MLQPSRMPAVGSWALIGPYWSFSSSRAAGTMLKLAAIGVTSVPQNPASMPMARTAGALPWKCSMSTGQPTAAVITGKAANALPMITVNRAMPTQ